MKPKEGQEMSKSAAKNKKKREAKARAKQEQEAATGEVVYLTLTFHSCYMYIIDQVRGQYIWMLANFFFSHFSEQQQRH